MFSTVFTKTTSFSRRCTRQIRLRKPKLNQADERDKNQVFDEELKLGVLIEANPSSHEFHSVGVQGVTLCTV